MDILKILGNKKRRDMLKILANKKMHISALARELGISTPVALKHVRLLESADLVERERIGNTDVLSIREAATKLLLQLQDILEKPTVITAQKGETAYNVLKKVPGIEMRKWEGTDTFYIFSLDDVEGYYIFLVNGKLPNKSVDKLVLKDDVVLEFQRLMPVIGRKIKIKVESQ